MLTNDEVVQLERIINDICNRIKEKYPFINIGFSRKDDGVYRIYHDQYELEYDDDEFDEFINKLDSELLGEKFTPYAYVIYDKYTTYMLPYNVVAPSENIIEFESINTLSITFSENKFTEYIHSLNVVKTLNCNQSEEVGLNSEAA